MPQAQPRGLLKNFRRKSSANALDLAQSPQETPAQSSFRVLERPDKVDALKRASAVLPQHHNTKSADNLNSHNHLAQSHSSAYYDTSGSSARHSSSSSTLPSSIDHDQDDNGDLFALRKQKPLPPISPIAFQDIPTPPTPSFSARAGRALSFGLGKSKTPTTPTAAIPYSASTPGAAPSSEPMPMRASMSRPLPARPVLEGLGSEGLNRNRAAGHTGYAASNKPPVLGSSFGASDFGGGLENIFDGLQAKEEVRNSPSKNIIRKIQSAYFDRSTSPVDTVQEDSDSLFPARTSSQQGNTPSPAAIDDRRYSWGSKKSSEELISGDSSAYHSPSSELFPVSAKATGAAALTSLAGMQGYETVPNEQMSPDLRGPAGPFKLDTTSADNHHGPSSPSPNPTAITSPQRDSVFVIGSNENTPRPRKSVLHTDAAFLYESPTGPENKIISPVKQRATPTRPGPKKMTSAQFAQAQRTGGLVRQKEEEEKSEVSENDEPEDEDDIEKQKKVTAQRRRQEATMSVYRQQMKKVAGGTGDTLSGLPAPGARDRSSMASLSIPNFSFANSSTAPTNEPLVEEEDEDIPLAILQAHGFPSKNRPPNMSSAQSVYAASAAGDHPGPLPAFARKLPQDPYFGSSLINPTNRQSLAFGNAAPSVHGGVTSGPPGGLVGVIATEEKARAGRRGSANQVAGNFSTPLSTPLPPNMQGQPQMPAFNRSMSMTSLAGPQMAMGMGMPMGMDPNMPMSPEQAAFNTQQQMAQLMQMQAQMMHQMMALQAQAGQMGLQMPMPPQGMQSMPSMTGSFMQSPQAANTRPPSIMGGRPPSIAQGRSMSMLSPPSNWGGDMSQQRTSMMLGAQPRPGYAGSVFGMNSSGPAAGYTPSIAPSERSNVGMPSRYRPVSTVDSVTDQHLTKSRSHTMTSLSYNPHTAPDSKQARAPSPLGADQVAASENATKPKTTIRIIDKLRGAPKSSLFGKSGDNKSSGKSEDDEDEAGWAKMARKREAMRQKRASKAQGKNNDQEHLAELYHGLDD